MYGNACKYGTLSPFTFHDYFLSDLSISMSVTSLNEAISNEMPYPPHPHPYLTEPLIYIVSVPIFLLDTDLTSAFAYCRPFKLTIPRDGPGPYVDGMIEFVELDTGEFHKLCFGTTFVCVSANP